MSPRHRLLVVDDEPRICQILSMLTRRWGYEVATASNGKEALELAKEFIPEVVISDLKMPQMDGEELLRELKLRFPSTQVIIITAHATVKSAVDAMKTGAFDYIMKPFDNDEIQVVLERAVEHRTLKAENRSLRAELNVRYAPSKIIGTSDAMLRVQDMIDRVGPTKATVLILGESGVGKELVARAIHQRSAVAEKPFVALNCASLSETLLESELFGHEKGAFTGATRTHHGKFEEADGGTIFLDEIGETSGNFQTKLLRILQEGTFTRVGSNETLRTSARVIAATNRDLEKMVEQGTFREDLYYRLRVVPLEIPPLRTRREDIPVLARHFLKSACQENGLPRRALSDDALAALKAHDWKGNVRELENTLERAVILTRNEEINADDLWLIPSESKSQPKKESEDPTLDFLDRSLADFVEEMTKVHILKVLELKRWKKQEAADHLGVDRATLYRMIKKFGIDQ
jgi:DNA-binding NtrC family response regulator